MAPISRDFLVIVAAIGFGACLPSLVRWAERPSRRRTRKPTNRED